MGEGFDVAGGDGADDHFLVPDEFGSVVVVILMGPFSMPIITVPADNFFR